VPVERPANIETTAMGAAGLAGIAAGVWPNAESFMSAQTVTSFSPTKRADVAALRAGWRKAVEATLSVARSKKPR
jgi:glycerol kinase